MGGRSMPVYCEHHKMVDSGDFGGTPERCELCEAEALDYATLRGRIAELESKLDALDKDYDALVAESNEWERKFNEASSRLDLMKIQADHWHEQNAELESRLGSIRERCEHMQAQLRQDGLSSYGDGFVSACDMVLSILDGAVERQKPVMGFRKERSAAGFFAPTFSRCAKCGEEYPPGFDHGCE